MPGVVKRTQEQLVEELHNRFGSDPYDWAFQCPACGDIATGRDFKDIFEKDATTQFASDHLGQSCIGRFLGALQVPAEKWRGRGCDWVAFGLFRGPEPEYVVLPSGKEIPLFPLAPASSSLASDARS